MSCCKTILENFSRSTKIIGLVCGLIIAPQILASSALTEYEAQYQLQWKGLDVGSSTHTLKKVASDRFVAEAISKPNLSLLPFRSNEKSEFFYKNNMIQPLLYEFDNEDKGKTVRGSVFFDWGTNEAIKRFVGRQGRNDKGEKLPSQVKEKLTNNTQDKVTYTLALRNDLKSRKENYNYTVIEPRKTKNYTFHVVGEEKVKTPMGEFDTLKLEHVSEDKKRITQIWMAKDFDYLMIKLVQIRDGKPDAEATIKNLKVLKSQG